MRRTLSLLAVAVVAALGANIVGEYELRGYVPFVAGPLFGLVIAEVALSVAGRRDTVQSVVAATGAGAGLAWGVWLSTSEGVEPWPSLGWVAIVLAVVVAGARAGRWRAIRTPAGEAPNSSSQDRPRRPTS